MSCCSLCKKSSLALLALVAAVLLGAHTLILDPKNWVFDPVTLQLVAKEGIEAAQLTYHNNATHGQIIDAVIRSAQRRYPNDVTVTGEWLFNNAGGAMGSMTILHASFSEYLIIFGTAVGTEGHTGRFFADDWFTIIAGEQWAYTADAHEREVYRPGDQHHLPWQVAKQYKMPDACWALEYARGNIPSMLVFGLADTFSSTVDVVTLWQTVRGSATRMISNLLRGKI